MAQITVTKNEYGKLDGFTDADQRAYAKFRASITTLEIGELFTLSAWFPRNPKLHRLHFKVMRVLFESQEQFQKLDGIRKWLYVGAGYADFLPGPTGKTVAIPKSIAYDEIDDADFSDLHAKVIDFMRSEHCRRFLWPHLEETQTYDAIEQLLAGFEQHG